MAVTNSERFETTDQPVVVIGQTGETGRPGRTGPIGPASMALSVIQVIALFIFVAGAFILLTWHVQVQSNAISRSAKHTATAVYHQCQLDRSNAASLTTALDRIIVAVNTRTDVSAVQKKALNISASDARPQLLACGNAP